MKLWYRRKEKSAIPDRPQRETEIRLPAAKRARQDRMLTIRCPYCVDVGQFKVMFGPGDGDRFTCASCGHLKVPSNPHFKC
jgi:hypothetical protein